MGSLYSADFSDNVENSERILCGNDLSLFPLGISDDDAI